MTETAQPRYEDMLRFAMEDASDAIFITDQAGNFRFVNRRACELLSYEREELLALNIRDLLVRDEVAAGPIRVEDLLEGQTKVAERHLRTKDGNLVASEVSTKMLPDGTLLAIVRDITERKQLDAMRDLFLTAVSHELRTPLTLVLGISATLQRRHAELPASVQTELLGRLEVNAKRLDRLLCGVLDLDRLRRGSIDPQREPTDITLLVHRVIENISPSRWFKVEAPAHVVCSVDAGQVERIVESLLVNVSRHTPKSTSTVVRVSRHGEGVLIAVEDDGPGVPDGLKERIFEPFQQGSVPEAAPGTGIGLALVARFAALHGGRAWVEDTTGGGASFRVYLPDALFDAECEPNVVEA